MRSGTTWKRARLTLDQARFTSFNQRKFCLTKTLFAVVTFLRPSSHLQCLNLNDRDLDCIRT
jgi:hypothetical protein